MALLLVAVLALVVLCGAAWAWSRRRAGGRFPDLEVPPEDDKPSGSPTIRILNRPEEVDDAMRRAAATASRIAAEMAARRFARQSVVEAPTKLARVDVTVPTIHPAEPTKDTGT